MIKLNHICLTIAILNPFCNQDVNCKSIDFVPFYLSITYVKHYYSS